MIRKGFVKAWAMALCALATLALPLCAMASASMALEADMGYEGSVTYVRTLPVNVRVTNNGADASGTLVVDINRSETEYDRYEMPLSIAAGSTLDVRIPVVLTQRQKAYTVRWMVDGQPVVQREIKPAAVIDPASLIVGTLGSDAQSFSYLDITKAADPLARSEYWVTVPLDENAFPSDVESLRFFDILAVDGFDMNALTDLQKQALDEWLKGGGIVLLGGGAKAAEDFGFFTQYTGITAGELEDGGDVTAMLLDAFNLKGTPLGQSVMTVELNGASGQTVGVQPLADVSRVGDGYVFTAAFALSEKPLNTWLGKNVMWQRMLITYAQARYKNMISARQSGGYATGGKIYMDSSITDLMGVENSGAMALPMVIIGLFVLLSGFGGYLLLKRLDKREWMWAVVPALAAAASFAMWAVSAALPLRDAIAVSYTVINVDQDGMTDSYTVVTASKAGRDPITVGANEGVVDLANSISYYANADPNEQETAAKLRYTCTYGPGVTVTYPGGEAWRQHGFVMRDVPVQDMSQVVASCRWEGENLVCTVTNGGRIALNDGVIMTDRGFASVPDLLPGQTVSATLKPAPQPAPGTQLSRDELLKDGVLLSDQDMRNYSIYDLAEQYAKVDRKTMTPQQLNDAYIKRSLINSGGYARNESTFKFIAFSDELADLNLLIDGKSVSRTAQRGMVNVDMTYDPVSADGSVRFLRGGFQAYMATVDANGKPALGDMLDQNQYQSYSLAMNPAFAFDVSVIPDGMRLTEMDISSRYPYYSYQVSLYNPKTGEWDEFKRFTMDRTTGIGTSNIILPNLDDYLANSFLFARFEKLGATDDYAEIDAPALTIDGRLE